MDYVKKFLNRESFSRKSFCADEFPPVPHLTITGQFGVGVSTVCTLLSVAGVGEVCKFIGGTVEEGIEAVHSRGEYAAIVASRLAHVSSPGGYHVLLECSLEVRARRQGGIFENDLSTLKKQDEDERFMNEQLCPGSSWSPEDFHLVLSTDKNSKIDVFQQILDSFTEWCQTNNLSVRPPAPTVLTSRNHLLVPRSHRRGFVSS